MQYNNLLGHNLKALPGGKFTPLIFENRKSEIKNPSSTTYGPRKREGKINPKQAEERK